jgi:hypothetical protein
MSNAGQKLWKNANQVITGGKMSTFNCLESGFKRFNL